MEEKRCERERKDGAFVALSRSPVTFIDVPLASSIGSAGSAVSSTLQPLFQCD